MSGTGFGTIVLHISPEAAIGGPLALVESGDMIELDVDSRRLHLDVSNSILSERRERIASRTVALPKRGYERLFFEHVQQADLGADFDFLRHPDLAEGDIVDLKD
jgi:dihydroxy-acid dehydratase